MAQPFTLYVIQSAHTDIGYTHPQEQIAWMYLDYYDRVLDLCVRDEHAPIAQRFKWTCETAWQVRNYVTARPERLDEFLHFVRAGQIEVTASYLHFTDLIDADAYRYSLQWAVDFCREYNLPLRCAMHCDINGWTWALTDLLTDAGIPYFCSQVHIDSATDPLGQRGSVHYHWIMEHGDGLRADTPTRIPQAFWWQGPGGNKTLHWLNEHYHLGNFLGLSGKHGFAPDKSRYFWESDHMTADDLYAIASREVPIYVERLLNDGYPYDSLLMSTSGYFVDNSPPDDRWCQIITRWNAEHDDIQLRTATLGEWFDQLTAMDTGNWPTRQVAWPDGWAHGLGTMANRIAQARRVQRNRQQVKALVEPSDSAYAQAHLAAAQEQELFALEHTFNAWMTTAIPNAAHISFLQAAKELNFHRAELHYQEAVGAALRARVPADSEQSYLYVAPDAAAFRLVDFDASDRHLDPQRQALVAHDGEVYPFQLDSHPNEMARYVAVLPVNQSVLSRYHLLDRNAKAHAKSAVTGELESASWRLRVDPASGGLASLVETARKREWVGDQQPYGFGQLVHESVVHPLARQAVGNLARMVALGVAGESMLAEWVDAPVAEHTTPIIDSPPVIERGAVFDAVRLEGTLADKGRVEISWRLYHQLPLVELVLDWDKQWSDLPEAAYVAFPFAHRGAPLLLETSGGFFQPGSHADGGQLAGTVSSYYTVQRAAHIQDADGSLLWLPLDAPLVMPQEIKYNRWETDAWDWNGFLASMPVNHYWHTNFASSQRGAMRLRYRLFSPPDGQDVESSIQAALPLQALGWR
jgi:hypothetical protein